MTTLESFFISIISVANDMRENYDDLEGVRKIQRLA